VRVAAIIRPNNGCSFYRILLPLEYMPWSKEDQVKLFYPEGTVIREEDRHLAGTVKEIEEYKPDLIFFNASFLNTSLDWLRLKKLEGVKLVADIDDYWEMSPVHPVYNQWYANGFNKKTREVVELVDLVFAATETLYKKCREEANKNCVIISNAVPYDTKHYQKIEGQKFIPKTNFLYAGGSTHYNDVLLLKNKFDKIGGDKYIKDNAIFTLAGFNPIQDSKVHCQWDKMASIFKRTGSYQILDTLPIQEHMGFYDQADVCLIPLESSEFNRSKSVLKIIEASTRELPCIVSDVLPYNELKDLPIFWEDWIKNIKFCIKNPKAIQEMGKELAQEMKKRYDINPWAEQRYQLFIHLLK